MDFSGHDLAPARVLLGLWRADDRATRPHSGIGWPTPDEVAGVFRRQEMALRTPACFAPPPSTWAFQTGRANANLDKS